ncbi:MAG: ABC transporter permease [Acidobacteriota bacterium]|nr:ABC transporter permease [Acidobacteriota bacterium]MDE3107114.1 ABC transporter permease [Acidobacteriota bacterium]MDE3222426.1 ABC transporter permease [Acidobacteriota bacterium]
MSATSTSTWSFAWAVRDTFTIARRNLLALVRVPTSLVFAIIQPIMFVVLFRYVFGGAINVPQGVYVNFLIPGILVQTTIFGSVGTAIGLAEDLQRGLIERFRALPMARMAVLGGRTVADVVRNVMVVVVITAVGFAVGFRPTGSVVAYLEAALLMLTFAYCLSWGFAFVGLVAPNSESAQAITFPLIFPMTFASSIFVPVASMPSWLQGFATYQPVSQVATAVRGLMNGVPHGASTWISLAWSIGALVVLAPLAVRRYRRVA